MFTLEKLFSLLLAIAMQVSLAACGNHIPQPDTLWPSSVQEQGQRVSAEPTLKEVTPGTKRYRDFLLDNVLHSESVGDIHYNLYVPESYNGSTPYALFITLPGYEGLYFQGIGANLRFEEYGFEAQNYNGQMIVVAPQLNDWGKTSAEQTAALTEFFLDSYNIDPKKVYLHGLSGGGETGSLVMEMRPELYAAYLATSTKWDGDLERLTQVETPVYLAIGEDDSYYGSTPLKKTYAQLRAIYEKKGLTAEEIDALVVLDIKDQSYFSQRGYSDQHAGGLSFAFDETIMNWLFSK